MQFIGYEQAGYADQEVASASPSAMTHHRLRHGEHTFLGGSIQLGAAGTLTPGSYHFGFKIKIPVGVPPSFNFQRGDTS